MISRGYRQVAPPSFCSLVQIHLGWEEYPAFATRDLSEYRVAYLFADGIAERLHRASPGRRCCAPGYGPVTTTVNIVAGGEIGTVSNSDLTVTGISQVGMTGGATGRCLSQMRRYGFSLVAACIEQDIEADRKLSQYCRGSRAVSPLRPGLDLPFRPEPVGSTLLTRSHSPSARPSREPLIAKRLSL